MRADTRTGILALLTAPGPYPASRVGEVTISEDRVVYRSPILAGASCSVWYRPDSNAGSAPRWCADLLLPMGSVPHGERREDVLAYLYGPEALAEVARMCRLTRHMLAILEGPDEFGKER
jgi:hypothetical protein